METDFFVIKLGKKPREIFGPLSAATVMTSLADGTFNWADLGLIAKKKNENWKRLFEIDLLKEALPELPSPAKLTHYVQLCEEHLTQEKSSPDVTATSTSTLNSGVGAPPPLSPVYLQVKGTEFGPMSILEMQKILESGKFKNQIYVWYKGLKTWFPVQEVPGYGHLRFEESQMRSDSNKLLEQLIYSKEARASKRKGIVATVRLNQNGTLQAQMPFGVTVNISETGIQVLLETACTLRCEENYHFEIMPLTVYGMPNLNFEGKVVWVKDGGVRIGISFNYFERDGLAQLSDYLAKVEYEKAKKGLSGEE